MAEDDDASNDQGREPGESEKERVDAIKALEHASGFIRRELVKRLQLRRLPAHPEVPAP